MCPLQVGGLPTPDVCWYLDGKAIRPDDFHKMLVCEKGMHSFLIEIVTVHHAGVYECVARNRAGEGRFSMRLNVLGKECHHSTPSCNFSMICTHLFTHARPACDAFSEVN